MKYIVFILFIFHFAFAFADLQTVCQRLVDEAVARGDQGGVQFCAYRRGQKIVDVWAGRLSTREDASPVRGDSLFPIFSTEKPLLATAVHRAVEKGLMDYDKPLCTWWPELKGDGKEKLTLRETLGYRTGLPGGCPGRLSTRDLADWDYVVKAAAVDKPDKTPGTVQRYLPYAYAWMLGHPLEVACGKPLKDVLDDEVLRPSGIEREFFFSVPRSEFPRVATFYRSDFCEVMNEPWARTACLPSAWAVSSADALCRFYNRLCGFDGEPPLIRRETLDAALKPCRHECDPLPSPESLKKEWHMIFGMGYGLWGEADRLDRVFGHGGAGGSEALVDRDNELVVAYTCNFSQRHDKLREALYEAVGMRWRYRKEKASLQDLQMKNVKVGPSLAKEAANELKGVFAPRVVAVPPTYAVRDLCRTAEGEIRHYGWRVDGEKRRRVYIASRDGMNWTTHNAAEGDAGAMQKSPYSGDWVALANVNDVLSVKRSKKGPGDTAAEVTPLQWRHLGVRQLLAMRSRRRWVACLTDVDCPGDKCYQSVILLSDDDARTWRRVEIKSVPDIKKFYPGDKRPRWFNNGCEPTVVELKDGTLLLAVRNSGNRHCFYRSSDGGETWSEATARDEFHATNTMPYLFRLSDGRILFFWNNTSILPTRDISEYPEARSDERSGKWELVFTNRDALHAAISEDDGRTWKGFREIILNPSRNAADFREHVNSPLQEHDKSVHQTQALELDGGKVLLSLGQNERSRRLVVFDPDWLYEGERREDFRTGLENISNHLYVKSLSGGWRGWAGHCAWNRVPGALIVRDPDTGVDTVREVLQLCRIRDERLISDRQGVVWNFPASPSGRVEVECRIDGEGFLFSLCDHWVNPCDETVGNKAALAFPVSSETLGGKSKWMKLVLTWDWEKKTASLSCAGRTRPLDLRTDGLSPFGPSYLHLQTLANENDTKGAYFRSFRKTAVK